MKMSNFINKKTLGLVVGLLVGVVSLLGPMQGAVHAVYNNREGIPSYVYNTSPKFETISKCPGDPAFRYADWAWISTYANTADLGPTVITEGTDAILLRFNRLGALCNNNIYGNASQKNNEWYGAIDKDLVFGKTTISSASITKGTLTLGAGNSLTVYMQYDNNSFKRRYMKSGSNPANSPVNQPFYVQALKNLPVGDHHITITIKYKAVNKYSNGRLVCVNADDGIKTANNEAGSNCTSSTVSFPITIRVKAAESNPYGKATAVCDAVWPGIRISGNIRDDNIPGQSVTTSFRIDAWNSTNLVDNRRVRRGPGATNFSFVTTDPDVVSGGPHKIYMAAYNNNNSSQDWLVDDEARRPQNLTAITIPNCPKPTNGSKCVPFTAISGGIPAATNGRDIAVVTTARQPLDNYNVNPNQEVLIGVSFENSGSKNWAGFTHGLALSTPSSAVLSVANFKGEWGVQNGFTPKMIGFQNGVNNVSNGATAKFWFKLRIPTDARGGPLPLAFQMHEYIVGQNNNSKRFGQTCSITLNVPEDRPYVTVGGGDVYSGASFNSDALIATDIGCSPTTRALSATIQTNGFYDPDKNNARNKKGSSSSQYATFASGYIGNDERGSDSYGDLTDTFLGNFGYRRNGMSTTKDALFTNIWNGGDAGEFYDGQPMPCIDITKDQQNSQNISAGDVSTFIQSGEGVRTIAGDINLVGATIAANGADKTLIVNGNVTLIGNITYPASYNSVSQVPHLKIIANNIYIPYGTRRIDADLVAIPTPGAPDGSTQNNGTIDTCSSFPGGAGQWFGANKPVTIGSPSCGYTVDDGLVFNGSVAARRILWKRTHGTLGLKEDVVDTDCYLGNYSDPGDDPVITTSDSSSLSRRYKKCAAELVNTSPQSLLNLFNTTNQNQNIPTSTTELPPVY